MRVEGFSREGPIYENIHALWDTHAHTHTHNADGAEIFFLLFNEMKCNSFFFLKMLQKKKNKRRLLYYYKEHAVDPGMCNHGNRIDY